MQPLCSEVLSRQTFYERPTQAKSSAQLECDLRSFDSSTPLPHPLCPRDRPTPAVLSPETVVSHVDTPHFTPLGYLKIIANEIGIMMGGASGSLLMRGPPSYDKLTSAAVGKGTSERGFWLSTRPLAADRRDPSTPPRVASGVHREE